MGGRHVVREEEEEEEEERGNASYMDNELRRTAC